MCPSAICKHGLPAELDDRKYACFVYGQIGGSFELAWEDALTRHVTDRIKQATCNARL